jgi:restriction system protein
VDDELFSIGEPQAHWSARGDRILKYSVEAQHLGLREYKIVSAPDSEMLQNKLEMQLLKWKEKWETLEEKRLLREEKEANVEEAQRRSDEAQSKLKKLETLLAHTLSVNDEVDWESLKRSDEYPTPHPLEPEREKYQEFSPEPRRDSDEFQPQFNLFDRLLKSKKSKKVALCDEKFEQALNAWKAEKKDTEANNREIDARHERNKEDWKAQVVDWEKEKTEFEQKQEAFNHKVEQMKKSYLDGDPVSVTEYCEMVLNNSEYPDFVSKEFQVEFNADTHILIVEYQLPSQDVLPTAKEIKYIALRDELKESYISDSQKHANYESVLYQMTIRSIHELFEADSIDTIKAISFNGWVRSINKATGVEENNCILTIQVKKSEFLGLELDKVDPKQCFKKLKGVSASRLSALSPIQPILRISKTDRRFIDGRRVIAGLESSTNIAAMDWEDFEHLIREVFEKEFSANGGEVKVTQASRDGGVDAVAFDPDPIRGGKIVIQAKRYTNTVGVSAVRDLYGTVLNEGATKGILVTTADYGPDAYDFAKGKPLTLLNGGNLLHLLGKHGHHVRIDLQEAKRTLSGDDQ